MFVKKKKKKTIMKFIEKIKRGASININTKHIER